MTGAVETDAAGGPEPGAAPPADAGPSPGGLDERWLRAILRLTDQVHYRIGADGTVVERILAQEGPAPGLHLALDDGLGPALVAGPAGAGDPIEIERRTTGPDGRPVWVRARVLPVHDAGGAVAGWVAAAEDVTALREAEERLRALRVELREEIRRNLATIRSVVRGSARGADSYVSHLEGRLDALARAQAAALRAADRSLDLESLLAEEMRAVAARHGRVRLSGPPVRLPVPVAELMVLAFHELATNAVKHGALAEPVGAVEVAWAIEDGAPARLRLTWRETTRRPVSAAGPPGFGTEFVEGVLAARLAASARIEHRRDGVLCEIVLPLPA